MPQTINSNLMDENIYAFEEFSDFIEKAKILAQASHEDVQKEFNKLYPSKK